MSRPALIVLALSGIVLGHTAGLVVATPAAAQAGGLTYAAAVIGQPVGGFASDGVQLDGNGNPVLDASYHRDGVDPNPQNPTNITEAKVEYGVIHFDSHDSASAGDGRQVLYGTLHNVPTGADYRWHVEMRIQHDHLARVINGPGQGSGYYSSTAWGTVHAEFEILDANGRTVREVTGRDQRTALRAVPQVDDDTVNAGPGEYTFNHVFGARAGSDKAKLVLSVTAAVTLLAHRPEVDVGGSAKMTIQPGGRIRAMDYGVIPAVVLKKADGTDAEWTLD